MGSADPDLPNPSDPAGPVATDRPWAIIQHVAHEGPGLISQVLEGTGHRCEVLRVDLDDPLPDHRAIAGLVVLGGPMGVHDHDHHPWLVEERALIVAVAAGGRPVLGVCLGAQQIAAALGAEVSTGPSLEIGFGQVELTAGGRRDPVTGPEYGGLTGTTLPCVHWHHDTFAIPDGADHLAATRTYPHQAFRWGETVYGLQFHIEVDRALAAAWTPHLPEGVSLDGPELARVEAVGRRLLGRFVGRAGAADPVPKVPLAGQRAHR